MDLLETETLLQMMLGATDHKWSVGTLSAFMALGEGTDSRHRLRPGARLLAFETLSSDPRGWNHGIALCLPECAVNLSGRVMRLIDDDPVDAADCGRPVLDLGLGQGPVRALFRPDSDAAFATEGMGWDDAAPILGPLPGWWIVDTPVLRAERRGNAGVALHSVPQALASGRTHAETTPVPPGLIPVAHVFPPHPARHNPGQPMTFDPIRHARFQAILARHGHPDLWALKRDVIRQLVAGRFDPPATDRHGATAVRVALRQHVHLHGCPPCDWLAAFDRPLLRALGEDAE